MGKIGKIYRAKKTVTGIPPSAQNSEYFEPVNLLNDYTNDISKKYAIPAYYIQFAWYNAGFREEEEPSTWYKNKFGITTTWRIMSNTQSVFFRTEGSAAEVDRDSDLTQWDSIKRIQGSFYLKGLYYGEAGAGGVINLNAGPTFQWTGLQDLSRNYPQFYFDTYNISGLSNNNETRVKNKLIRVYLLLTVKD